MRARARACVCSCVRVCVCAGQYNQGATATHEVGHYLGLLHTFNANTCPYGDVPSGSPRGCNVHGDLICDTSPEQGPIYDCDDTVDSCNSADPIHNFMDYSHDSCLIKFTEEQVCDGLQPPPPLRVT